MLIDYDTLNNLREISLIAESKKVLTFTAYKETGELLNVSYGGNIVWSLYPIEDSSFSFIVKDAEKLTASTFSITLETTDTVGLEGRYIQQVAITDSNENNFRPIQGVVVILPPIPDT
jgi:hypothetical protein